MKLTSENLKYHFNKLINKLRLIYQYIYVLRFKLFGDKHIKEIIIENRKFLLSTGSFIEDKEFRENDYGMSQQIYENINRPIHAFPTYTDLILYSTSFLKKKESLNYLEIGTSVLKNYFQIENHLNNSNLYAYDINPVTKKFENLFENNKNDEISSDSQFLYSQTTNKLTYFRGSVLNEDHLKIFNKNINEKFDIVFSDALHTPEGVRSEYENIISNNLTDDFILYFDDLDFPGLFEVVNDIYNDIKSLKNNVTFTTFKVYGWIGQYEKMHKNGIISNLDFYNLFKKNNLYLPSLKKVN